jgi:hypothetical protein
VKRIIRFIQWENIFNGRRHPWNYRNFEGIIPSTYGAGTVIVWDVMNPQKTQRRYSKG